MRVTESSGSTALNTNDDTPAWAGSQVHWCYCLVCLTRKTDPRTLCCLLLGLVTHWSVVWLTHTGVCCYSDRWMWICQACCCCYLVVLCYSVVDGRVNPVLLCHLSQPVRFRMVLWLWFVVSANKHGFRRYRRFVCYVNTWHSSSMLSHRPICSQSHKCMYKPVEMCFMIRSKIWPYMWHPLKPIFKAWVTNNFLDLFLLLHVSARPVVFLPVHNRFYPSRWWVDGSLHKAM